MALSGEKTRILVIDDNPLDLLVIAELVKGYPLLENCGSFMNALEGYEAIRSIRPDVVFMDIEMPVLNGIELLRKIRSEVPVAIFVTSFAEYAVEGFELSALDYILKPLTAERFAQTITKIDEYRELKRKSDAYQLMVESDSLTIKEGHHQIRLSQREIIYLEAMQDYTKVVTTGKPYLTLSSLSYFLEQLPAGRFLRIHRSYAVALGHIRELRGSEVVCSTGRLPIGKTYRSAISRIKL
ncbi:LytTR family DNA-binding domain-containing protein [Ravibacter arvi]|uniref:LytTR family DNA-binding domain-containing protein n=1 Tax=Ravibacter arvi TaxID=2051041 RepID=A0ABP8M2H6_9BACT